MKTVLKTAAAALAFALAAPALAQVTPPAPAAPSAPPAPGPHGDVVIKRYPQMGMGHFAGMSDEGRVILREAMRSQKTPQDKQAIRAARQRLLDLIAADRLDVAAVRRAQAAERDLVMREHEQQQEAMLAAYQKLSPADRKAFAQGMRSQEERMLDHMKRARERMEQMEKRMRERMKERESGAMVIEPLSIPIAYPISAGR